MNSAKLDVPKVLSKCGSNQHLIWNAETLCLLCETLGDTVVSIGCCFARSVRWTYSERTYRRIQPFCGYRVRTSVTGSPHLADVDVTSKYLAFCSGRRMRTCKGLPSCWTKCSLVSFPLCPAALQTFHALTHSPTHLGSTSVLMKANWQPGKLASSQFSMGSLRGGCEEVIFHVQGEERLEVVTSTLPSQKHYDGRVDGRIRPYFDAEHSWRSESNPS